MENNLVGASIALAAGLILSLVNYKLSDYFMKKKPDRLAMLSFLRSIIQVGYLLLLFVLAPYLPWDRTYLLIGAALGITVPMFFFTCRLLKKPYGSDKKGGKEDTENG